MKTKEAKLLKDIKVKDFHITRIRTRPPFMDLFPVDEEKVKVIAEHMRLNGYDQSQPLILWDTGSGKKGPHESILIDGHTRLQAAKLIDLRLVPIVVVKFKDEDEALQYAIHNQRDRRNLLDPDLTRLIQAVDKRKRRGGDHKSEESKAPSGAIEKGKSSKETAAIVGTSARKVEKVRRILSKGDKKTKDAVLDGTKTINAAHREIKCATPVVGAEQTVLSLPVKQEEKVMATNAAEPEPKSPLFAKPHFLCPNCGMTIFEDQLKMIRKTTVEQPATVQ